MGLDSADDVQCAVCSLRGMEPAVGGDDGGETVFPRHDEEPVRWSRMLSPEEIELLLKDG